MKNVLIIQLSFGGDLGENISKELLARAWTLLAVAWKFVHEQMEIWEGRWVIALIGDMI